MLLQCCKRSGLRSIVLTTQVLRNIIIIITDILLRLGSIVFLKYLLNIVYRGLAYGDIQREKSLNIFFNIFVCLVILHLSFDLYP